MSLSDTTTSTWTPSYHLLPMPPALLLALSLSLHPIMIGRYVCDLQASMNIWQKYMLAWYIIFISVEIWNAKYVIELLPGPTKMLL
jgi:hypothetical protein